MKEKFIKSTIILLIGGFITKVLGMLIKIVMARTIGTKTLGTYMLILPTFMLLISLSQFGLPIALAKLISEETRNNKKLFFTILPVLIIINILLSILIVITAPIISNKLLHNSNTYLSILAMSLVIPFTSTSSVCRSYFFGKSRMFPHVLSNIIEDITRLLLLIITLPKITIYGTKYTVAYLVLINIISEIASTIILIFFLPRNIKITKNDLVPNKNYLKDSLKISIPNTGSRLIGSIGYFLEPIIITTVLLKVGYTTNYITTEYGIISGYVIPLILLPSFFTMAISQALLPVISKEYIKGNKVYVKRKITQAIILSLLIGIPVTIILVLKPTYLLNLIYHTNKGTTYIKILAPICLFQYIQAPLASSLDAMNKSKDNMLATLYGTIIRTTTLYLLSYLKIGFYSLIIATTLNILIVTFYEIKKVRKYLT